MAQFLIRKRTAPDVPPRELPPSLQELLLTYDWPGNVRELENVIRKLLVLGDGIRIEEDLRAKIERKSGSIAPAIPKPPQFLAQIEPAAFPVRTLVAGGCDGISVLEQVAEATRDAERRAILAALKSANWNRRQASALLKTDYKALLYKMKKLSIKEEKSAVVSNCVQDAAG